METKNFQNCKNDFQITEDDFGFYKKMDLDIPNLCPPCRNQRRLIFRNERILYKRICDLCKKETISVYSKNKNFPVYCYDCWWGDKFDGEDYAMEYSPDRPFFEQWKELFDKTPKPALVSVRSVNCQYLNFSADNKNCYMIYESSNNEDCSHCYWIQKTKDCVDCSFTHMVEFLYDSKDCYNSSRLFHCLSCYDCVDSYYLYDCHNCINCIGCVSLRNKSFCIFNEQYSKEEYFKKLKEMNLDTHEGREVLRNKFEEHMSKFPRKFAQIYNSVNVTGNYISNAKNCVSCFHTYDETENCRYCMHAFRGAKDCMDCNTVGRTAELIYNCINTGIEVSNNICTLGGWSANFVGYSFFMPNSEHCFGCVGMKKKKYAILNKVYSKDEYEKIKETIVAELKKDAIYGEFFPKEFSPFAYNESSAIQEYPVSKEEAIKAGFLWEDEQRGTYDKGTITWDELPKSIKDISIENIIKNIYTCSDCKKNYRIIQSEAEFYKRLEIPLPHECPDCRHTRRIEECGPNKLWPRSCMCTQNNHDHTGKCSNEFETSYAPDRKEIIYCESCYQKEVI